ncbi:hypothetical protein MP228_003103 [Amoeboaphelidium protococcarum]|nr:hypothetical protein MP228_003103 [Amoeboaphelidium protococcarum]
MDFGYNYHQQLQQQQHQQISSTIDGVPRSGPGMQYQNSVISSSSSSALHRRSDDQQQFPQHQYSLQPLMQQDQQQQQQQQQQHMMLQQHMLTPSQYESQPVFTDYANCHSVGHPDAFNSGSVATPGGMSVSAVTNDLSHARLSPPVVVDSYFQQAARVSGGGNGVMDGHSLRHAMSPGGAGGYGDGIHVSQAPYSYQIAQRSLSLPQPAVSPPDSVNQPSYWDIQRYRILMSMCDNVTALSQSEVPTVQTLNDLYYTAKNIVNMFEGRDLIQFSSLKSSDGDHSQQLFPTSQSQRSLGSNSNNNSDSELKSGPLSQIKKIKTSSSKRSRTVTSVGTDGEPLKCQSCHATETPEWRKGPLGPRTLCNACGLIYAKLKKKEREQLNENGGNGNGGDKSNSSGNSEGRANGVDGGGVVNMTGSATNGGKTTTTATTNTVSNIPSNTITESTIPSQSYISNSTLASHSWMSSDAMNSSSMPSSSSSKNFASTAHTDGTPGPHAAMQYHSGMDGRASASAPEHGNGGADFVHQTHDGSIPLKEDISQQRTVKPDDSVSVMADDLAHQSGAGRTVDALTLVPQHKKGSSGQESPNNNNNNTDSTEKLSVKNLLC